MDFLPLDFENDALHSNCEVAVLVFKDHGTHYLKHFILCPNVGAFLSIRNHKGRKALELLERKRLFLPILASLPGDSQCASRFEIPDLQVQINSLCSSWNHAGPLLILLPGFRRRVQGSHLRYQHESSVAPIKVPTACPLILHLV